MCASEMDPVEYGYANKPRFTTDMNPNQEPSMEPAATAEAGTEFTGTPRPLPTASSFQIPVRNDHTSAQSQRALNQSEDGDFEEAPTVCWENYRNEPCRPALLCSHETFTPTIHPCGANCKTSSTAESKPKGKKIFCKTCADTWSKVFIPRKRKATNQRIVPNMNAISNTQERRAEPSTLFLENGLEEAAGGELRTPKRVKDNRGRALSSVEPEQVTAMLNKEISADRALQELVATASGPGVRLRSAVHGGLALRKEVLTNEAAARLDRNLKKLVVDGTDRLRYGGVRKHKAADDPNFATPDREYGDEVGKVDPLERAQLIRQEQQSDPDAEAPTFDDYGERFCICQTPTDANLVPCTGCDRWFHPECLGKEHPGLRTRTGKRARFFCLDCDEEREKHQALADEVFRRESVPNPMAEKRAATIKKREEAKMREAQTMSELFGESSEDVNTSVEEVSTDHMVVDQSSSTEVNGAEESKPDVEMSGSS